MPFPAPARRQCPAISGSCTVSLPQRASPPFGRTVGPGLGSVDETTAPSTNRPCRRRAGHRLETRPSCRFIDDPLHLAMEMSGRLVAAPSTRAPFASPPSKRSTPPSNAGDSRAAHHRARRGLADYVSGSAAQRHQPGIAVDPRMLISNHGSLDRRPHATIPRPA